MAFFTALVQAVAYNVEERIVKQFQYLTQHKKIQADLGDTLQKLQSLKERVQRMVEIERRNGNAIRDDVQFWLIEVDRIENEWQRFYDVEVAKKTCFGGQCPNLAFKYSLSKRAAKEIEKITVLIVKVGIFDSISYSPFFSNFREDIKISESRRKYITELIENLKDDRLKRISICGLAGMGKTTLAKNLVITLKTTRQFDAVAMAVVSQNPNYNNIQAEIADCLGFYFEGETLEERSMELNQRLKEFDDKKVKVLIVLDDVRQTLDFESIGLPSPDHQKGLKILLTSRSIDVCKQMGSEKNLLVPPLPDNEAWDLFREMAGDVVDIPDIYPIARQVVKELWGMPLAIVVIGRTLSQKEDVVVWKDALDQMKPEDMGLDRYSSTEISFKSLDNVHKSCLLLCSLFPKDLDIPVESLLRQGVGLGLFEATDAVWKERNRVNDLVNNLKSSSLLLDSEKPGCVRMHDVVRQEVLKTEHGISDTELKLLNQKQKQKEGKWLRMLLILDNKIELVKNDDPECPTLELIQVWSQNNEKELIISRPEELINGMSKLKVLVLKNLCIPKAAASLFHSSVNLHTLQLEGCDLGDISVIGKEFNKLEILSFANSNIKELPTEIGNLGSLRLLDLTGCDDLTIIAANVFARLSRLEELYFRVKKFPWMLNQDFVQELRNLSQQLTVLEIKVNIFPNDFIFGNLQKFWVSVVPYSTSSYEPPQSSNMLQLRVTDYETIKSTMQLVEKCEILILEKVKDLKNVIHESDVSATGLKNVKDLRLHSCPNIQCVIDCTAPSSSCVLPLINSLSLEKLELKSLPNFIGFSNAIVVNEPHQPIRQESSSATEITDSISGKLFSSNWMKQFPKLKTLLLKDCISLEMVFDLKECSKSTGLALDYLFPKLGKIEISFLKKLSCVWGNVDQDSVQGFQNLRSLTISNCDSLKYVFTSVIARAIKNLEELKVSSCELIENIVWSRDDEGDNNKGHMQNIEFKKLQYLSLSKLPKLVSMCSGSLGLEFPSLRKFEIDDCPMLKIFSLPIPTQMQAIEDTLLLDLTEDTIEFDSLNENNSRCSTLALGCFPFQPKFIHEGNLDKKIRKEASLRLAQDHVPSIFGMKSRQEIVSMPVLEDLCVINCDVLEVLFSVEENYNLTDPSYLKTIKIENCDNLKTMVASRDKRKDVINLLLSSNLFT